MKKKKTIKLMILLLTFFSMLNLHTIYNLEAETRIEDFQLSSSSSIKIESDQDFIDFGFTGSGTESDPYMIENLQIIGDGMSSGIEVTNTTKYFVIKNCTIKYSLNALFIEDVAPRTAKIVENNLTKNTKMGIWIESTVDAYIAKNEIHDNFISAIRLENCSECLIEQNICYNHTGDSLLFGNSENLLITKNYFVNNTNYGIKSWSSSGSTISNNYIANCFMYGVYIDSKSSNHIIHHNDFVDNFPDDNRLSQACSYGENNIWYDAELNEGNYWNEHSGDGNYTIAGEEICCDPYPLNAPVSGLAPEEPEETNLLLFTTLMVLIGFLAVAVYAKRT